MHREQCQGARSKPEEPQRKSDTGTRVDPKTSPIPRLEGNPPAVPAGFLVLRQENPPDVSFIHRSQQPHRNERPTMSDKSGRKQAQPNAVNNLAPSSTDIRLIFVTSS